MFFKFEEWDLNGIAWTSEREILLTNFKQSESIANGYIRTRATAKINKQQLLAVFDKMKEIYMKYHDHDFDHFMDLCEPYPFCAEKQIARVLSQDKDDFILTSSFTSRIQLVFGQRNAYNYAFGVNFVSYYEDIPDGDFIILVKGGGFAVDNIDVCPNLNNTVYNGVFPTQANTKDYHVFHIIKEACAYYCDLKNMTLNEFEHLGENPYICL